MSQGYPYKFLSQIHADQSGWDDCFQASLGAYLVAAGKIGGGIAPEVILNEVSLASRGSPDQPGNPDTTLSEADLALAHYDLPVRLTTDWLAALNAPWAILLVDGVAITKADGTKPYPASYFGNASGPDHFIVSGPPFQGAFDWCMNPLDPAGAWAHYNLDSLRGAFNCAYLLPPIPAPKPTVPPKWMALRAFGLLSTAQHGSTALATVPKGGTGLDWGGRRKVAGDIWGRFQFRSVVGWSPLHYVTEMLP